MITRIVCHHWGSSRNGLRDMGGDIDQWCTDWYAPYVAEAQTNPCNQTPSNFRVIRGGSWGYYGYRQRATDREFNSERFPGHIFYGLRVALSEGGWQKLNAKK